jgi:hypothetical protein
MEILRKWHWFLIVFILHGRVSFARTFDVAYAFCDRAMGLSSGC